MMLFSDAVKEGDSAALLKFLKVALLLLHSYSRVKYAYVVLLFLAKVNAILSEKGAFEVLQNRYFNSSGKAGGNIPLDLRMEHLNKLLKLALKQLASNVTEAAAQRIAGLPPPRLSPAPARFFHFFLLNDFSPLSRSLEQAKTYRDS